jgi:MFS transporter, DHA1 family, multidrug resistance protein
MYWIVSIIGTGWFSIGAFLLFNLLLGDAYVLAGNNFMRPSFGAGFPAAMYKFL